ncbi:MAG: ribosomal-processing cysteine protease Prp [Parasporobacterium sp.]|nr:ribosomal-processing cysteine protease Prp [Parasporobacterium sp.]
MIRVIITRHQDQIKGIQVKGHSDYSEAGTDIVCASVSALVINTINSIEKFTDDKMSVKEDPDIPLIEASFDNVPSYGAGLLMKSLVNGLEDLSESTEHVKLSFKEE